MLLKPPPIIEEGEIASVCVCVLINIFVFRSYFIYLSCLIVLFLTDLISVNSRGKFTASQRKYKLFAVVNHEGKEATKGHYVAYVFHGSYGCWVRYDDSSVKAVPEKLVLKHDPPRVPYLLFYRRADTLNNNNNHGNNNNNVGSKSNKM